MKNTLLVLGVLLVGVMFRFVPHPMNFTPVIALALLAGRWMKSPVGVCLPVLVMLLSDLILGFSTISYVVYGSLGLIYALGVWQNAGGYKGLALQSVVGASVFFIVTNGGAWWLSGMYPHTLEGLMASWVAGLPFFHNTLLSTVLYGLAFEKLYRWVEAKTLAGAKSANAF